MDISKVPTTEPMHVIPSFTKHPLNGDTFVMDGVQFVYNDYQWYIVNNDDLVLSKLVTAISNKLDAETLMFADGQSLCLVGDNTQFLNAIRRKVNRLNNFLSAHNEYTNEQLSIVDITVDDVKSDEYYWNPIIVDSEVSEIPPMSKYNDIDYMIHNGMSCCATAIKLLFQYRDSLKNTNVSIIGRGHAVQGLAACLTNEYDCTVTVCHSKTKNIIRSTLFADVVIVAAPVTPSDLPDLSDDTIIIDLSGTFSNMRNSSNYVGNIGKLTTSIIINRVINF